MSKVLTCVAIDDEQHALDLIALYAQKSASLNLVASTTDPWEGKKLIEQHSPDLVLLDIQMPEVTGLQLLDVSEGSFDVIITSAYSNYALEGYRYDVTDYLLKPFSYDRFAEAIDRVLKNQEKSMSDRNESTEYILIKGDRNAYDKVFFKELLYLEGLKNYVKYICEDGKVVSLITMGEATEQLPNDFMRVHRSFTVNLSRVKRVEGNQLNIDGTLIPIGKTYRDEVFKRLGINK